jgi:hypothetical protein
MLILCRCFPGRVALHSHLSPPRSAAAGGAHRQGRWGDPSFGKGVCNLPAMTVGRISATRMLPSASLVASAEPTKDCCIAHQAKTARGRTRTACASTARP